MSIPVGFSSGRTIEHRFGSYTHNLIDDKAGTWRVYWPCNEVS